MLDLGANGPDEADELPGECSDDLPDGPALVREVPVAAMQALLGTPGHGRDLRWQRRLQLALPQAEMRSVPVVPGGLDENAAQV